MSQSIRVIVAHWSFGSWCKTNSTPMGEKKAQITSPQSNRLWLAYMQAATRDYYIHKDWSLASIRTKMTFGRKGRLGGGVPDCAAGLCLSTTLVLIHPASAYILITFGRWSRSVARGNQIWTNPSTIWTPLTAPGELTAAIEHESMLDFASVVWRLSSPANGPSLEPADAIGTLAALRSPDAPLSISFRRRSIST
jgi:hypothetical protein